MQRACQGPPGAAGVHGTPLGEASGRPPGEEMPKARGRGAEVLLQRIQTLRLQRVRPGEQAAQPGR